MRTAKSGGAGYTSFLYIIERNKKACQPKINTGELAKTAAKVHDTKIVFTEGVRAKVELTKPNQPARPMFTNKALATLILPLVLEQVLGITIGMADTMMVSSVGEAAVSGISLVDSVNVLLMQVFAALATGGAVVGAQYLGHGDQDLACESARQLYYAVLVTSLAVMGLSLAFRDGILSLVFGTLEPDVLASAQTYSFLSALSYPFLGIYNAGAALFRSMGNSKISLYASLFMNIINIGGNALLIYGFGMGVAGAATATLVSRIFGAMMMTLLLRNKQNPIHLKNLLKPTLHWDMIKKILYIGVPNGLESSVFQVGKVLLASLISTFGTASIAANAVAGSFSMFQVIPGNSIGLAMITVVGQCVGAGDKKQAKAYAGKLLLLAMAGVGLLGIFEYFLAPWIVSLYNLSAEASELAIWLLQVFSICAVPFHCASFCLPNALRAANDVRFTMLTSLVTMWVCRIGSSYLFASVLGWGMKGVWIGMICDWIARGAIFLWRFWSGKWLKKTLI